MEDRRWSNGVPSPMLFYDWHVPVADMYSIVGGAPRCCCWLICGARRIRCAITGLVLTRVITCQHVGASARAGGTRIALERRRSGTRSRGGQMSED